MPVYAENAVPNRMDSAKVYLTLRGFSLKYRSIDCPQHRNGHLIKSFMSLSRPVQPNLPSSRIMEKSCQHPRVQIVARQEECEYVECLECREIFDSSELKDMAIEERTVDEAS
jgi:hypothetical protein